MYKPLRRLGLLSAAAIGAMTPDLDLILPIRLTREQTHGSLALLTFCLPIGLTAWAVFQALIKPALIEVLPNRAYVRLCAEHMGPRLGSVKAWSYAALAVLFGALTHIIWDGFTHEEGLGAHVLSVLRDRGVESGDSPSHLYRWLQHGSSVIGVAVVFMALWLWIRHASLPNPTPERRLPAPERHRWVAVYVLIPVLLVGVAAAPLHQNGWQSLFSKAAFARFAVIGTQGAALGLVFTSALIRRRLLILGARHPVLDI